MTWIRNALFLVFMMILGIGCQKEDQPSRFALLTEAHWRPLEIRVEPAIEWNGALVSTIPLDLDACNLDDYWVFNPDETITAYEGEVKCDPDGPGIYEIGTWSATTDLKYLTFRLDDRPNPTELVVLNTDEMHMRLANPDLFEEGLPTTSTYDLVWLNVK